MRSEFWKLLIDDDFAQCMATAQSKSEYLDLVYVVISSSLSESSWIPQDQKRYDIFSKSLNLISDDSGKRNSVDSIGFDRQTHLAFTATMRDTSSVQPLLSVTDIFSMINNQKTCIHGIELFISNSILVLLQENKQEDLVKIMQFIAGLRIQQNQFETNLFSYVDEVDKRSVACKLTKLYHFVRIIEIISDYLSKQLFIKSTTEADTLEQIKKLVLSHCMFVFHTPSNKMYPEYWISAFLLANSIDLFFKK